MKILCIDGMTAPKIVWNALVKPIALKYKVEAVYSEWQNWPKYSATYFDVIVGHSLGGDSAIQFCNFQKPHGGPQPKMLMTLGARHQSVASWFDWLVPVSPVQNFVAPNANTHNFYTYGLLPSSPMEGAVENVRIGLPYWHGSIPAAPQVQECLEKFFR